MTKISTGSNPPTVFISQIGTGGDSWLPVIELLTTDPMAVTYDRPGTGDCPPRPAPNPALRHSAFADELANLLDQHGVTEPAVIVGHSIGSPIARMLADLYPHWIAGMVHVDGPDPCRRYGPGLGEPVTDGDGPDATEIDIVAGGVEVAAAAVPAVPTVVMTHTPGLWPPDWVEFEPYWTAHQQELARQCNAPLVVAANAGHQIPADAPALVAYVVDEVVRAARTGTPVRFDLDALAAAGGALARP